MWAFRGIGHYKGIISRMVIPYSITSSLSMVEYNDRRSTIITTSVSPMPLVYRCKTCGLVLHYLERVGQDYVGVPSIREVLSRYGYTCPHCKSRLSYPSQQDITITSVATAQKIGLVPVRVGDHYFVNVLDTIIDLMRGETRPAEVQE